MNPLKLLLSSFFFMLSLSVYAQENDQQQDPDLAYFDLRDMVSELDESGRPWKSVMNGENVLTGIYKLKAGVEDKQSPHATDEVYYVVSGKGKFRVGEEEIEVQTGSILFVKAKAVHQFFDISEDLVMVVFFDK